MGELAHSNAVTALTMDAQPASSLYAYSSGRPYGAESAVSLIVKPASPISQNLAYEMKNKISEFSNLPLNWDGYGAIPVNKAAIENSKAATALMFSVLPEADIFPNPNGTITFEWENEKGTANLEIGDSRFSFYIESANTTPFTLAGDATDLSWLISHNIFSALFAEPAKAQTITAIRFFNDDNRYNS